MQTDLNKKQKTGFAEQTVGQIVASEYRTAEVFQQYGIDFCCGGDRVLTEVCKEKNIDINQVVENLEQVFGSGSTAENSPQFETLHSEFKDFPAWSIKPTR